VGQDAPVRLPNVILRWSVTITGWGLRVVPHGEMCAILAWTRSNARYRATHLA